MADLTTLDAVKTYLGVVNNADDTVLQSLITNYSAWFEGEINYAITATAYDIRREGRGRTAMMLPASPIISVQALTIDTTVVPAQSVVGGYGYRFTNDSIVLDGISFGFGRANVRIQFTAGYAVIPVDVAQAINELVGLRYRMRDKLEFSSKSLAGETITFITKSMPDSVKETVMNYKRVVPA